MAIDGFWAGHACFFRSDKIGSWQDQLEICQENQFAGIHEVTTPVLHNVQLWEHVFAYMLDNVIIPYYLKKTAWLSSYIYRPLHHFGCPQNLIKTAWRIGCMTTIQQMLCLLMQTLKFTIIHAPVIVSGWFYQRHLEMVSTGTNCFGKTVPSSLQLHSVWHVCFSKANFNQPRPAFPYAEYTLVRDVTINTAEIGTTVDAILVEQVLCSFHFCSGFQKLIQQFRPHLSTHVAFPVNSSTCIHVHHVSLVHNYQGYDKLHHLLDERRETSDKTA